MSEHLRQRFETSAPSKYAAQKMAEVRLNFADFAEYLERTVPYGEQRRLAFTRLEEAKYWANQAIILWDNEFTRSNEVK